MNLTIVSEQIQGVGKLQAMGLAHADTYVFAKQFCGNQSSLSQEWQHSLVLSEKACRIPGKTSRSVAAHFSFAAIGIVIAHTKRFRGALDGKESVRSDPSMPVAEMLDLSTIQAPQAITVINHDKVVTGSIHLGEL